MIVLTCDRTGCDAHEPAESWFPRPNGPDTDAVIGLPEGWGIDQNGLDHVVHCPDHRSES
jgi:hypothetical protein